MYNVCPCALCSKPMSYRELRECVYWLPDMTQTQLQWAMWDGFEHRVAHRRCWKKISEKARRGIRNASYPKNGPMSMSRPSKPHYV